jgi:lipoprotein NlpI
MGWKRLSLLLTFCVGATGALAAANDDIARGLSAVNRGDNDGAIAYFSQALEGGNLDSGLAQIAYFDRARAYMNEEECGPAAADLTSAISLKPDNADDYMMRGRAYRCAGRYQDAIADYTEVIRLAPSGNAYWQRALARYNAGDFDGAATDSQAAMLFAPKWPYPLLWFAIARMREGKFEASDIAGKTELIDQSTWPGQVFALYKGDATPDDILRAAQTGDAKAARDNLCEAHFYLAEWWLAKRGVGAARSLLEDVRDNCRHDFIEYSAARAELNRL